MTAFYCNWTVSLRARQSSALNRVLLILVSPLLATRMECICDVLITSEKEDFSSRVSFSTLEEKFRISARPCIISSITRSSDDIIATPPQIGLAVL